MLSRGVQASRAFFCQVWSPNPTENAIEISHAFRDSWINAWQWHLFLFLFGVPANWNMVDIWLVYLCCSGFKKSDGKLATVGYMGSKNPPSPIPDPRETNLIVGDIYETPQQSLSQLYLRGSQGDSRLKCCFWEVRFEVLGWFQEFFHEHVLLCNYWVVDRLPSWKLTCPLSWWLGRWFSFW